MDRYSTLLRLEDSLRAIRFEPRPSLEAELLWRLRRKGAEEDFRRGPHWFPVAAATAILGALIYFFWKFVLTLPGS